MKKSVLFASVFGLMLSLQTILAATCSLNGKEVPCENFGALGGLFAMFAGMIVVFLIILVAIWIYMSLAFTAIAKKANLSSPGIAWIPGLGPAIIAYRTSQMHWWPWLLLIGLIIPFVNFIAMIIFGVYAIIWQWKMFEAIGKPGWWALICLITPVNLVMYGIAAWSNN